MDSERLHRVPGQAGLSDENLPKDLQREFNTEHTPEERMLYEDSVPMDRQPTLPVADILGADRQERSWSWMVAPCYI
jgi:hypothetical protein